VLDWIIPILLTDKQSAPVIATVVLRASTKKFLEPLLNNRATSSSETLLIGYEANAKTYLNELRYQKDRAFTEFLPTNDPISADIAVATAEHSGIREGKDYRGESVLAAFKTVANTNWLLMTKIDHDEVFAPLQRLVFWVSLISFFASVCLSAALLLIWRQQRKMQRLLLTNQQAQTDILLQKFFDMPFIGMGIINPDTKCWLRFNDHLCTIFGYSRDELIQKNCLDLTHPEDIDASNAVYARLISGELDCFTVDTRFIRKDGATVFASIDAKCTRKKNGQVDYIVATIQDITLRKANEAKIHRLTQLYSALSQCNQAIVRCTNEQELFPQICRDVTEFGGMKMAWIGIVNPDNQLVEPVASFGFRTDYLQNVNVSIDPHSPLGRGPTGTAIRENRPIWCQNFQQDPITSPWHERGKLFGWGSSASLPIHKNGAAIGSFTLYAGEIDAFDEAVQSLLIEMAMDISYALERFELESRRRHQETEILKVKNQLQDTLAAIPDLLFEMDLDGRYHDFHSPRAELLMAPVNELIGKKIADILPINATETILLALNKAHELGHSSGEQFALPLPQGVLWFELSVSRKLADSDQQPRFIVLSRDITERKQAEQRLKQYAERLEVAEKHVGAGSWEHNLSTGNVWWSKQMYQLLGFEDSGAAPGFNEFIAMLHPEDRTAIEEEYAQIVQGLEPMLQSPREFRSNPALGKERYFSRTIFCEKNAEGKPIKFMGTLLEITQLKQAETQLNLAAKVFAESSEGVIIADAHCSILMVNRAFTEITGYSEAEALGKNPRLLKSGQHDHAFYSAMWQNLHQKGHWQGEIWNRRKSGEIFPMLETISVVSDKAGQITNYIAVFADITESKASEARLEFIAHHDPLTCLPNRLLLFYRLEHGIDKARRDNNQLALLMLDLDRFKDVNDSFGHFAGDQLLQLVAKRLGNLLREADTVARLGGDEFTVLLEDINHSDDVAKIAENIINNFNEPWQLPNIGEVRIGVSIGISLFPQHGNTPEILLQQADTALYQAKEKGRNRFSYFSDDLTLAARARIESEARLRKAIINNELRVYYQPQMDITTGRIIGAEALVRWQDPEEGLIAPDRFIAVAETTGLIVMLGEWVLRETCRQGKAWLDADLPGLNLGVNVSPYQLRQCDMPALVAVILEETGFPAAQLELELTESGLMDSDWNALDLLDSLRGHGIRLAIDDFGTGYSSLAYLKLFPLDVLKIDKSFIDDIPFLKDDMEITAAIVAMGHNLGFKVLAEGVETAEQLLFLKNQGCDLYQGYLKSRPLPAEEFAALLIADAELFNNAGNKEVKN
ncbi:MAG: EAL domain-containing protein, partial [Methylococcales bacterium]